MQLDLKKNSILKKAKSTPYYYILAISAINYCLSTDHPEYLAIGDFDGNVSLYSQSTLELLAHYKGPQTYENRVQCILMDQSVLPNHIVTGSQDGIIRVLLYDPVQKSIQVKKEFYGATEPVTGLFIDQQKKQLVSTSKEAYSKVWDLKDFSFIVSLVGHRDNTVRPLLYSRAAPPSDTSTANRSWPPAVGTRGSMSIHCECIRQ